VLAVKGSASIEVLDMAGKHNLDGKIVIDTTNPIDNSQAPVNGVLQYYTSLHQSQMELLQAANPNAHFVKAFNSIGSHFMVNPTFPGGTPSMFICGNDEAAKKEVSKILVKFGFEVEDMGAVEGARAIEPLCILWCIPGMLHNSWSHAFKLLRP
ncbi:MAG: DNA-binding protein, partial [Saprospiraceae bacterium]